MTDHTERHALPPTQDATCERVMCPDCSRHIWTCQEHWCDVTRRIHHDHGTFHDETLCADCHEPLKMRDDARKCPSCQASE